MASDRNVERARNVLTCTLSWIAMVLAAIDIPAAIVMLIANTKYAISLPWYHYANFGMRICYDLLVIVTLALLLAGPLTNTRAKVISILSLFGMILVLASIVMIALEAWSLGPFEIVALVLWRVCVLIVWIAVAVGAYYYDSPSCRTSLPYYDAHPVAQQSALDA